MEYLPAKGSFVKQADKDKSAVHELIQEISAHHVIR